MQKKFKWGILGCAGIAESQFLPALQDVEQAELWAIGSSDLSKAQAWATSWGAQRAYGSYIDVLDDPEVEAVYIPLPNHLHAEWTIKALQAKKHVLCEKPMAVTVEQAEKMLQVAQEEQRLFMEGFMYRFHPQISQALSWIEEGQLGEVSLIRGSFSFLMDDWENIRLQEVPGAGSLWDVGCYPIHFMNLVFGGPPRSVLAKSNFHEGTMVDLSMAGLLDYGQGRQGLFDCSFERDRRSSLEIVGTEATITIPVPWRADRQEVALSLHKGNLRHEVTYPINNPYQREIEHFHACIEGVAQPLLPGFLGRDLVATIKACYLAASQGTEIQLTINN